MDTQKQIQQLLNEIDKTRETWVTQTKETERKTIFGSGKKPRE